MSVIIDPKGLVNPESSQPRTLVQRLFFPYDAHGVSRIPWTAGFSIAVIVVAFFSLYRWYMQEYGFTYGMDYFDPDFQTYWMRLFWIQMTVIPLMGVILAPYLWFTRPKDPHAAMTPEKELSIYYLIFTILAVASLGLIIVLGLVVEGDAAWHQVTIRDTDFTPTHIQLFYLGIPAIITGVPVAMVWLHTRMPDFIGRVSTPLFTIIAAAGMIMPVVGFNEWAHTFFYAEELFGAPVHWGFVVMGWGFFALAGFFLQCLNRVRLLTSIISRPIAEDVIAPSLLTAK